MKEYKTNPFLVEPALIGATGQFQTKIKTYDNGSGLLFISRDSMGINGIIRADTWQIAYEICEDEFFPSADDEAFEKEESEMTDHEQACWNEAYGFRPNGQGGPTPDQDRGVYSKDLNGDYLDLLTDEMMKEIGITLQVESEAFND